MLNWGILHASQFRVIGIRMNKHHLLEIQRFDSQVTGFHFSEHTPLAFRSGNYAWVHKRPLRRARFRQARRMTPSSAPTSSASCSAAYRQLFSPLRLELIRHPLDEIDYFVLGCNLVSERGKRCIWPSRVSLFIGIAHACLAAMRPLPTVTRKV